MAVLEWISHDKCQVNVGLELSNGSKLSNECQLNVKLMFVGSQMHYCQMDEERFGETTFYEKLA